MDFLNIESDSSHNSDDLTVDVDWDKMNNKDFSEEIEMMSGLLY